MVETLGRIKFFNEKITSFEELTSAIWCKFAGQELTPFVIYICSDDNEVANTELHIGIKCEDLHVNRNCVHEPYGSLHLL